jgi:O-antigen ligase
MTMPESSDILHLRPERLMPSPTRQNLPNFQSRLFWFLVFFFFAVFFFFDGHTLLWSLRKGLTIEQSLTEVAEGNIGRRISLLILFVFGLITLMRKSQKPIKMQGLLGWLILFFLAIAFASLFWANDVGLTFRRLTVLAMFSLSALAVAGRFSVRNMIWLVLSITAGYLCLGLAAEIGLGTFQPWTPGYQFSGTHHPNHQGINCALLLLAAVFLRKNTMKHRGFLLAIALVAFVFLILTKSRTSFASAIITLLVYWNLELPQSRKWALFLLASITFCLLFLLFEEKNMFSAFRQGVLLGRESDSDSTSSLMGRVPLWKECLAYVARRPLLGYGYGSFWTPRKVLEISSRQEWGAAEAHSGYLELALGLGLVGMISYILILVNGIHRAFALHRMARNTGYGFLGLLLVFCGIEGLMESVVVLPSLLAFFSTVAFARLGFHASG